MKKTAFSRVLSDWCDRTGNSVRKLAIAANVHDSDLSRIREGTKKRITRDVLSKILNCELVEQNDRLAFIRAFLKDEVPEGELREGESFADHTEIVFPHANINLAELSPVEEALEYFRRNSTHDDIKDFILNSRRLISR